MQLSAEKKIEFLCALRKVILSHGAVDDLRTTYLIGLVSSMGSSSLP
jgi:hypothetical protein